MLEALVRRAADDRRDGPPLGREELRQVQELLLLFPGPLGLLHAGVQPLIPARLALLRALPRQEQRYPRPVVEPALHDRSLEDLILA
eukprot:8301154-Heterocapsa_arctica.AAC.1